MKEIKTKNRSLKTIDRVSSIKGKEKRVVNQGRSMIKTREEINVSPEAEAMEEIEDVFNKGKNHVVNKRILQQESKNNRKFINEKHTFNNRKNKDGIESVTMESRDFIKSNQISFENVKEKTLIGGREIFRKKIFKEDGVKKARSFMKTLKVKRKKLKKIKDIQLFSFFPVLFAFLLIILTCILFGSTFYFFGDASGNDYLPVSDEVNAYSVIIEKYARKRNKEDYMELFKAVMMVESRGKGTDPMDALKTPYNKNYSVRIKNAEYSIMCGVFYLSDSLDKSRVKSPLDMENIRLALQGYDYGIEYVDYAIKKDGGYSVSNADEYSKIMASKKGIKTYGDKNYPSKVLKYYPYGSYNYGIGNDVITKVAAKELGNYGGRKFWSWYGFKSRTSWCACFVSWCAGKCGYLESGIIPRFSYAPSGYSWFKEKGQLQTRTYEPRAGDIIFFDWDGNGVPNHVGIVENTSGGFVHTIEGNSSDAVRRRTYTVGARCILGYGVPKY